MVVLGKTNDGQDWVNLMVSVVSQSPIAECYIGQLAKLPMLEGTSLFGKQC